ncbi:uncharacterized protein LOC111694714 [Eurytemora carolleeae]|uniref:uncharacterized protein LOC111694714 n=1 Tax=Eurytemora carolleeae TaxID=1294199 RepID=UPI000C77C10D|nr:uncharacterized protein LOC111694714 [Eurytemora carolleeae]|eukprot:XP_023319468.1 uncharacterized protein LOC111694714 [Eurytemora affinis]
MEGNPRPRSNTSSAWNYFIRYGQGSARCSHCGVEVAVPSGSTTGMFSHLQKHHPTLYKESKLRQMDKMELGSRYFSPPFSQKPGPLSTPERYCWAPELPEFPGPLEEPELGLETDLVLIKATDAFHLSKTIYPGLVERFGRFPNYKIQPEIVPDYDLIIHCSDGRVPANKLLLGGASLFVRSLLTWRDLDHIYFPDFKVAVVHSLLEYLYTGTTKLTQDAVQMAELLGIKLETVNETAEKEEDFIEPYELQIKTECEDDDDDEDDNVEEEEDSLELVGLPEIEEPTQTQGAERYFDVNSLLKKRKYDEKEKELERKALELKEKIFAECSRLSAVRTGRKPSRLPSKIWNWFIKTPTTLTCRVCGGELRNCGNTTNAACHLRKHPKEFQEFRRECETAEMERFIPLQSAMEKERFNCLVSGSSTSPRKSSNSPSKTYNSPPTSLNTSPPNQLLNERSSKKVKLEPLINVQIKVEASP